jgi:hypothetical protein
MKKMNKIPLAITLIILLIGCEETKDPAGQRNIGIVPAITDVNGMFISGELSSSISFRVSLAEGEAVENATIEVSSGDEFQRTKIADITSFPSDYTLTLGDITEKIGAVNEGEVVYIEVVTTKNGVTTRSNAALAMTVFCMYDVNNATGSYHSISPPSDWNTEGDISLKADQDDQFKIYVTGLEAIEGINEDQGPLVMHIDPATFNVVADKTVLASDFYFYDETNIAYEGTGTYNSCTGTYEMNFHITTDQYDYGTFQFTFTKN